MKYHLRLENVQHDSLDLQYNSFSRVQKMCYKIKIIKCVIKLK